MRLHILLRMNGGALQVLSVLSAPPPNATHWQALLFPRLEISLILSSGQYVRPHQGCSGRPVSPRAAGTELLLSLLPAPSPGTQCALLRGLSQTGRVRDRPACSSPPFLILVTVVLGAHFPLCYLYPKLRSKKRVFILSGARGGIGTCWSLRNGRRTMWGSPGTASGVADGKEEGGEERKETGATQMEFPK